MLNKFAAIALLFAACASLAGVLSSTPAFADPKSVAFLGVELKNDNAMTSPE